MGHRAERYRPGGQISSSTCDFSRHPVPRKGGRSFEPLLPPGMAELIGGDAGQGGRRPAHFCRYACRHRVSTGGHGRQSLMRPKPFPHCSSCAQRPIPRLHLSTIVTRLRRSQSRSPNRTTAPAALWVRRLRTSVRLLGWTRGVGRFAPTFAATHASPGGLAFVGKCLPTNGGGTLRPAGAPAGLDITCLLASGRRRLFGRSSGRRVLSAGQHHRTPKVFRYSWMWEKPS